MKWKSSKPNGFPRGRISLIVFTENDCEKQRTEEQVGETGRFSWCGNGEDQRIDENEFVAVQGMDPTNQSTVTSGYLGGGEFSRDGQSKHHMQYFHEIGGVDGENR
jgi:hypothetical protein